MTFDFHNTLARCDQWFQLEIRNLVPAFLRWHAQHGGPTLSEQVLEQSVQLYRDLRLDVMRHGIEKDAFECVDAVTRRLGLEFDLETIERGVGAVMSATLDDSQPMPGVVAAVQSLKRENVKLGVVSSAVYHPFLEWSLEKFGIKCAFDTIVTSASSGFYKSRTEIYEVALQQLGATADGSIHVGDSYRFDVETARKLGMRTVWLDLGRDEQRDAQANLTVSSLEGIDMLLMNGLTEQGS